MIRRLALIAAMTGAAGCVDFTDPVAPWTPNQAPQAVFQVQVTHPASSAVPATIQVARGDVFPGTIESGHYRDLGDPTLFALGDALEPAPPGVDGWYRYGPRTWSVPGDSLHRVRIRFELPRVEGVPATPPVIDWTTPSRVGSGLLTVKMGEPVVLQLQGLDAALEPPPGFQRWTIDLNGPRGSFNIGSNGVPRTTLRVPAEWVPAFAGEVATVTLTFFRDTRVVMQPGQYSAYMLMLTSLQWTVQVVE